MKLKRVLSFIMAFVLILSAMPAVTLPVSAATYTEGDYTYEIYSNPDNPNISDYAIIVDVNESIAGDVVIPLILGGYDVRSIGNSAFSNCSNITSVTIPDQITYIGSSAFSGCTALVSINIPDSITAISSFTFKDCSSLTAIIIPNSVLSIGNDAFYGCSALCTVNLSTEITSLSSNLFYNCVSLTGITIPESVNYIGSYVFSGCTALQSIHIPSSVTRINTHCFSRCENLKSVYISDLEKWCNVQFDTNSSNPLYYGAMLYINNELATDIKIPKSITRIRKYIFSGCNSIKTIELPNTVTTIDLCAFDACYTLTSINIPDSVTTVGAAAFRDCKSLTGVDFPQCTIDTVELFSRCASLKNVKLPNGIKKIGRYAFYECASLEEIVIPEGVHTIDMSAFYNCSSLTSINMPDSVATLGNSVFGGCSSLQNISFSSILTSIPYGTFSRCTSLEFVNIPDNIKTIGNSVFTDCSNLKSVEFPNSISSIGTNSFWGCYALECVEIPEGITSIGQNTSLNANAFSNSKVNDIYYYGSEEQWSVISNNTISGAYKGTVHYIGDHNYYTYSTVEATCGKDGQKKLRCFDCDWEISVPIVSFDHKYALEGVITPSTSTDFGYTSYICIRCGDNYKTNWTEPTVSISGSCGENAVWAFNEETGVLTLDGTGAVDAYTATTAPWNIYSNQIYAVHIRSDITAIGDDAFSSCNKIVEIKNDSAIGLEKGSALNGGIARNAKNIYSGNSGQSHLTYQDDFVFITDGETGYLVDYRGSQTVLELPEEYVAYNASTIRAYTLLDYSLSLKSTLSKIILPNSVGEIGKHTFANSTAITDFYIFNYNCNIPNDAAALLNTAVVHGYYGSTAEDYANTYGNPFVSITLDFPYGTCGDTATWSLNPDTGALTVSGTGSISDYEPGMAPWYANKDEVKSIYIEPGITQIGSYAFYGLSSATYIDLGYTVKTIGANAFENCESIRNITLPETVTKIGSEAFMGCSALEGVIIPDSVAAIWADTFSGCTALESVVIGAAVAAIDATAFENCTAITTVKMRGAPPSVSTGVFGDTSGKYVYYYDTLPAWDDVITDGMWKGYYAIPYSIVTDLGFNGNNVFAVKVVDKYNEPITNATVSFGPAVKSTNNDGLAYFVNNNGMCQLSVSASGFTSFSDKNYTVDDRQFIEFIVLSDSPSTIAGVNCNGKSIATSVVKFNCNSSDSITISVSGNSPRTILKYELLQGNRVLSTVHSSGNYADFTVKANSFEEGEAVIVKMYISDGTYVAAALNIQPLHMATVTAEGLIGSKDSTNINLPLIGSFPFDLEMAGIASTSIAIKEDTIKVGFNIEISEDMSESAIQKAIKEAKEKSKILAAKPKNEINAEIAGYIEIKYLGNDEYVVTKSSVSLAVVANLEANLQASFAGVIGVYFTAGISSKGELELVFVGYDLEEGFAIDDLDLTIENALKIEGGVYLLWGAGKAGFYGKGEAGFTVEIAPQFGLEHVYIKGDVGVNWSVLWGWIKGSRSIWKGTLFEEPENYEKLRSLYTTRVNSILSDPDNYQLNDRAYLNERSKWLGNSASKARSVSAENYSSLQENVYYNIAPKLVTCNGITMMVWLDDNANRDVNNYQTLYYSIYDPDTKMWTSPVQIDNNDTFDCEFDLFTEGNDIYVVYTEKTALESNVENLDVENEQQIAALIDDIEVRICKFDGQNFSFPVSLTSNTCCETLPKFHMVDGVVSAMWSTLEPLGIDGVSARDSGVFCSKLINGEWSAPVAMIENSHQILSVAYGKLTNGTFTAYIVDTDGKNETGDDYALILADESGEFMQISSGLIKNLEFVNVNGVNALMWCDDSNIYYLTSSIEKEKQLFAENLTFDGSFKTEAIDDETVLIIYIAANEDATGTDVYGIYFNGETTIGFPFKITNTAGYIDDFDIVYRDGNFIVSFIETFATFVGDELETTSDFKYLILPYSFDVRVNAVDYDITAVKAGENFDVTVSVENIGNAPATGLNIYLYDSSNGLVATTEYSQTILPGDTAEISTVFTAPADISNETYYIVAQPTEPRDKDTSNNTAELLLGFADLSVKIEQKNIGNKRFLHITVTNNGNIDANTNIPVRINKGEAITTIESVVIKSGETKGYLVDASAIDDGALVYAELETKQYDPFTLNDQNCIPLTTLIYADPEEMTAPNPVLSTTGVNYNKFTDSTVKIIVEQGAEKFVGIEGLTENVEYTVEGSVVTLTNSYLQALPNGVKALNVLFDYQLEAFVTRTLTITVFDTAPVAITGSVQIAGSANVGNTLYADLSGIEPYTNTFDYEWTVDAVVVSNKDSYTVKKEDFGKTIELTVTAKAGFTGKFSDCAIVGHNEPTAPVAPVVISVKDTAVQLVAVDGIEYSLDGINWQVNNVFENLLPNTEYTFYARLKATETSNASPASVGVYAKTLKSVVPAPPAPAVESKTHNTIALVANGSMEYKLEGGEWTDDHIFTDLKINTTYTFYQRYKETDTTYASAHSSASITTDDKITISGTIEIEGDPQYKKVLAVELTGFVGDANCIAYQWYCAGTAIPGATQGTYLVTESDIGKEVTVVVTGTGLYKGELTASVLIRDYADTDFTVIFRNEDGSVISTEIVRYGDPVVVPETPVKAADNTYTYVFAGWDKTVVNCAGDVTYTATYTPTYIDYTVEFKDWDGTVLTTETYHYGDKVSVPADPTKAADNTYTYTFKGWDKEVVACTGNATYTATYTSTYIDYSVVFKNWDGTEISSNIYHWGDAVTVPEKPVRPNDDCAYSFAGWDLDVTACDGNKVYTATYKSWQFADVNTSSWQIGPVVYACDRGFMAGKGTDAFGRIKFDPNSPITREEFVQVLYNAENKPSVSIANKFPDVGNTAWYKNAVLWANSKNIANGMGNGNFGVGMNITRQDLALMLYKYAAMKNLDLTAPEGEINKYADGSRVSGYAQTAMNWAVKNGVLSGKGVAGKPLSTFNLDPTGTATRAECAAMLKNFMTAFGL